MDIVEFNKDLLNDTAILMAKVYGKLHNKDQFVPTSLDTLRQLWDEQRIIILGCIDEDKQDRVAAVAYFKIPNETECYVNYCSLDFPVESCIHAESVAVDPMYRGKHLQQYLLRAGEDIARQRYPERVNCFCTVHPKNRPSVVNLKALGFNEVAHYDYFPDTKHSGMNRSVMYKSLV